MSGITPDLGLNSSVSVSNFYTELKMEANETIIKGILDSIGKDSVHLEQLKKAESAEITQKSQQYSSAIRGLQSETYKFFTTPDVATESAFKPNSTQLQGRNESDELRARMQNLEGMRRQGEVTSIQGDDRV
ncbi:hypothetical protein [uncultured Shewanella sp.]|uniref:hypothetical protein n=1 Tax=uncultured Shewanella sp. TaxID=173975 RepID=UPI0026190615|nr:hypothetical protein [uncultured Shewanella sp.]